MAQLIGKSIREGGFCTPSAVLVYGYCLHLTVYTGKLEIQNRLLKFSVLPSLLFPVRD